MTRWLVLWLAACGGEDAPVDPTVDILSPVEGEEVTTDALGVTAVTTGFRYEAPDTGLAAWTAWLMPTARAHEPGESPYGYLQWRIDGADVLATSDPSATLDLSALGDGAHSVEVELFYPDGDAFYPPVVDVVGIVLERP
jgi:hypothetical protein